MAEDLEFSPVTSEALQNALQSTAPYDLVAVTLMNGDVLLGGIFKHWAWNDKNIQLSYNTSRGQRFGLSRFVTIPLGLVSAITIVPLNDESAPRIVSDDPQIQALEAIGLPKLVVRRLLPQDYPNPLASIIFSHNNRVAGENGLSVGGYGEMALPEDAIPPEGIGFTSDFLLYADWDFFLRQTSGGTTVTGGLPGLFEISKDTARSQQQEVLQRLREHAIADKIRRVVNPTVGEVILHGCVLVDDMPETTEIEGVECHLWAVVDPEGEVHPVLSKVSMIKYPVEFIRRINSVLTFYGELLPIPLNVLGTQKAITLLSRAIAYFHTD